MLASPVTLAGLEFFRAVIVLLAILGVIFWRIAIRIMIILFIILLISGAIAFVEGFLHGIR